MNSLLTLAKDLEQKSKAQQQTTGEMLKAAFSEHEKSVRAELSESEKRISAAILDHDRKLSSAMSQRTKGMLRMVSQTWLTIVLVSTLLIASSAGILWWQGQQILDNYTSIREQKDALEKLNARTWGVRYQEDSQGRFLVLPEGVKADTNWTFDNGRKKGIRLVQE
ncbi:mobilization protein [Salmonella enterica subsp. enterica serovar Putten]|uniref:Mobilization protein n=10 Tax=Gammaproteobacteria TaxID=1236 RepID=A0AAN4D4U5_CITFR|nr:MULTISPECIES: MbeB family mobilization protein [Gammaproteobacteria]EDT3887706.1 mobilization protein [Salmonella enterica subsp. enterica serovar Putten]EGJ0978756.1 mobilization protein [Salmonella enterica]EJA9327635.1 mobilization protein [Salmonella enterica subsp. enterica serovar London]HBU6575690.1 mobilization protein [Citrobacter amalonaticus]HCM2387845.1 mobilization protein [Salmonella enterica subsp. enterica serovar Bredeney]